jgi:type VI secretion system protein ImpG
VGELFTFYQDELTFLRKMGVEFARKHGDEAAYLELEEGKSRDPHVERMIEAFAFLAARIHIKLNDGFPEITQALLSSLYPHYLRPVPSMSIAQFHLDPAQGQLTTGLPVKRSSTIFTKPVNGYQFRFQTCYETTLWPIKVSHAQWMTPERLHSPPLRTGAAAALRIELSAIAPAVPLGALSLQGLQFCLYGEPRLTYTLYELLCNNCCRIQLRDPAKPKTDPIQLADDALRPMGFEETESMLPYTRRSFTGYRLLQEYFVFPGKFLFFDLNLKQWPASLAEKCELIFLFDPFELSERQQMLEAGVSAATFCLGCSPVINLFPQTCEPILLNQTKSEYPIEPNINRRNVMEIFSIEDVVSVDSHSSKEIRHEPFYSYRHGTVRDRKKTFWHASRRAETRGFDTGTNMYLSLVDLSGRQMQPDFDSVTVRAMCTNGDLPSRLPLGSSRGSEDKSDFELEGAPAIRRIIALGRPTESLRPETGADLLWRLISHLSLNYLSLVSEGKHALQEILTLYNFAGDSAWEKQIAGIASLKSSRHFGPVESEGSISFARGTSVEIEFDEEQFAGGGVYLFASVLERFFGLYVSLNSFSQLTARTQQRREAIREWPPRAGQSILL